MSVPSRSPRRQRLRWILPLLLAGGCGPGAMPPGGPAPAGGGGLPPVPPVDGPLALHVVYPSPTDLVDAGDSTFLFGSVGTGRATLEVNGAPVRVWPNGAWLAWVPVPPDSLPTFSITARTATDSAFLLYPVHRVPRFRPPAARVWIDTTSFSPGSRAWWPADEELVLSLRAAEGAEVRLVLPGGGVVPMAPDVGPADIAWGIRAFDRDTGNLAVPTRADRYLATIRGRAFGRPPGPLVGAPAAPPAPLTPDTGLVVEAIVGGDTARARWPLRLALIDGAPTVVTFNDDTAGRGGTDSLTVGRARPGATYHWFLPSGTRAVVTGRLGDDLRVRLSRQQEIWVAAADALSLPPDTPPLRATVASVTATPAPDRVVIRIPLTQHVPYRVEEAAHGLTLRLYSAVSDINWTRYGPADPYLREIRWLQAASDEVTITVDLGGPVWGYRTRWNRNDLLLEVRRPPAIDPARPLAGRLIIVDPGHPPLGATGPTGLREATANYAVSVALRALLQAEGARVVMTRGEDQTVDLWPRVRLADSLDADLLISIHNNALPDGVNPFTNHGASVFYNHSRSLPLARAIQRELVRRLGQRDLGAARGDLALTRPTWMPAVLCEGLFMMLPDQEAALRHPEGQRRYALAVRDGIIAFLRGVAVGRGADVP